MKSFKPKYTRGERNKLNQRQGAVGQNRAIRALLLLGVLLPEEIATPVTLRPAGHPGAFYVTYKKAVSGDHRGIMPGGRSVLAETKSATGDRLNFSELRKHQPQKLTEHAQAGGISLLIWSSEDEVFVMRWPVPGFKSGTSITIARARELHLESLPNCGAVHDFEEVYNGLRCRVCDLFYPDNSNFFAPFSDIPSLAALGDDFVPLDYIEEEEPHGEECTCATCIQNYPERQYLIDESEDED